MCALRVHASTRHATRGSLKDSESDSAQGYGRAEFHETEIHLDSLHACDDSGCKNAPGGDGNQLLRKLEVPHLIWPGGEQRYVAKAMIIFLRAAQTSDRSSSKWGGKSHVNQPTCEMTKLAS